MSRINVGDRFTCRDGTVVEVIDQFQRKQTRAYSIAIDRGGYADEDDCSRTYIVDECKEYRWEDMSWDIARNRARNPDGTYDTANQLYLCSVDELDDRFNEFGQISP